MIGTPPGDVVFIPPMPFENPVTRAAADRNIGAPVFAAGKWSGARLKCPVRPPNGPQNALEPHGNRRGVKDE